MDIGEEIRAARLRAGLTQTRLARRARTSQAAVSDYEAGKRVPEAATLARIRRATKTLPSVVLDRHRSEVLAAAADAGVSHLRVFGSVARGEDGPDSDIDLIADLPEGMGAIELVELCERLEAILGTKVDLLADSAVPADEPIHAEATAL